MEKSSSWGVGTLMKGSRGRNITLHSPCLENIQKNAVGAVSLWPLLTRGDENDMRFVLVTLSALSDRTNGLRSPDPRPACGVMFPPLRRKDRISLSRIVSTR